MHTTAVLKTNFIDFDWICNGFEKINVIWLVGELFIVYFYFYYDIFYFYFGINWFIFYVFDCNDINKCYQYPKNYDLF